LTASAHLPRALAGAAAANRRTTVHEADIDESDTDDPSDGFYDDDYDVSDTERRIP